MDIFSELSDSALRSSVLIEEAISWTHFLVRIVITRNTQHCTHKDAAGIFEKRDDLLHHDLDLLLGKTPTMPPVSMRQGWKGLVGPGAP